MGTLHLLKTKIEGDELTEVVNILDHSVFKLEQFSMLARQISILKSPDFKLKISKVSLKQVVQFGSIETREELREQGIQLERNAESDDLEVNGDSGLLVSCLVNLIQFAKGHTEINGTIAVDLFRNDQGIICSVADSGINYSGTVTELLETQFSGGDNPLNLALGIGLAVCQMIMESHGGRVVFEKSGENRGILKMVFPHE
jgi:signal transduction histidine kinase